MNDLTTQHATEMEDLRVNLPEDRRLGPWMTEPDLIEFDHAGLHCKIVRVWSGALCGYVAIPPGHPAHREHYSNVNVDVHGGLTYAGPCRGLVCHVPRENESDDVWWLGFDTNHYRDYAPFMRDPCESQSGYKTIDYVRHEVESLAEQLSVLA